MKQKSVTLKWGENGTEKMVTEPFLFDALSFTEAESRVIEEVAPYITGEFTVSDIKRSRYSEIFLSEDDSADLFFKCKVLFITINESGAEKKTATNMLVQASDLRDAIQKLDKGMEGCITDYQISSVVETAILDVYPYMKKESEVNND